ncbi:TPA: S8 family serine peptidase, partial [Serratia odorifera]
MKITTLALLIYSGISLPIHAAQTMSNDIAWQGHSYDSVIVKLKASATLEQKQPFLSDSQLPVSALFKHQGLRSNELAEMSNLDKIYGFDRYLKVNIPENRTNDIDYINSIIQELKQDNQVELVYPEPEVVSLDKIADDTPPLTMSGLSYAFDSTPNAAIPDFLHLQDYKKSPTDKRTGYYMGGVNRDSVNSYTGNDGAGISLVSTEITPWNPNHINLPDVSFYQGDKTYTPGEDHGTSSVGIMAAKDIGTGVKGLTWNSRMGYTNAGVENLYKMIPKLQAGDVLQFGVQTNGGEVTGCTNSCWVPMENYDAYYNIIKALTDKGVHVIQAAANGNINLDHPAFNGKFDLKKRDSGSILAGAFCAINGKKASFSTYGSRVTSASWGCWDVATTGYGDLHRVKDAEYTGTFSGTSSANPIIAGVVASLSGIAKANGITVSPIKMREILQQTGTPLAAGDSAHIGTHPDMAKAVERILELKEDGNISHPVAIAGK